MFSEYINHSTYPMLERKKITVCSWLAYYMGCGKKPDSEYSLDNDYYETSDDD